ncbi:MAG: diacylglycerol kinase family lipid kinase [Methanocorpusculum sp.]|nr:diacylglycerol kinase family lipid kinase [Methanocorpusculum sp.]
MTKYTFLVNPQSSSGSGEKVWKKIEPELKRRKIAYTVHFTTPECGATETVRRFTADGRRHTIIVLGGDGTINEVVNGIAYPEKITLGYIPTGSGNDFTRALKLPTKPLKALEVVLNPGRLVPLDIGSAEMDSVPRRFAVSTGIGFDASVCHYVEKSPFKTFLNRIRLGNLVYTGVALQRLFLDPLVGAEVVLDDGKPQRFSKTYFAACMNHPYEGGGFFFCPEAKTDDGMLDVLVVAGIPRIKVLFVLPTAFFGKHTKVEGVHIFRCRKAEIRMTEDSPVHTDGEPVAVGKELKAEVCREQIMLMAPVE